MGANDRIGWGVLSTGRMASTFTRDLALLGDEADLVAVASRDAGRAAAFAAGHGLRRSYGDYAALAADPDVDVVYVASTHNDHRRAAEVCLEAGKAVLVEKPLTTSAADTDALLDLAGRCGRFAMEAMWTRTHPLIRHAAALVTAGEIGEVRHLTATFGFRFDGPPEDRLLDPAQAGGAILDAGVYPVHAAHLFLGEPAEVYAAGSLASTGVDAHAAALLSRPASGRGGAATAQLVCSLQAALPTRLEIYGTEGRVMIEEFFIRAKRMEVFRGDGEPEEFVTSWPGNGYTFQAQEVMRCLRAGELESPMVPWAATRAVARTLDRWRAAVAGAAS